ncbi:MAG: FG-GAP-like repeat-containing protein [Deltaproteobacteria bacterium]|nr:FG-GAP-like repeat-containing protein [Myxococcales bacterium]MDP3217329.1 FG-GAP-like repeat-containing protein [Deltaproteobacteria bacterium]
MPRLRLTLAACALSGCTGMLGGGDDPTLADGATSEVVVTADLGDPGDQPIVPVDTTLPDRDTPGSDIPPDPPDLPALDAPGEDRTAPDVGTLDTGAPDAGQIDTGAPDVGARDTGVRDVGPLDVGPLDAGIRDAGPPDLGVRDVGPPDTGPRDVGVPDSGVVLPPPCAPVAGGGSATVRVPTLARSIRGMGDTGWLGSPAVVDLDRDNANEIVVSRGARVTAYTAAGAVRWTAAVNGSNRVWAAPVIADFQGDANLEVAAAAGSRVTLLSAAGTVISPFPVTWRDELRSLAAGDLDGDGRADIVTASSVPLAGSPARDLLMAWRGTGAAMRGFPPNTSRTSGCDSNCDVTGAYDQGLAVGRIDNDALMDVLAPMDNAYMSWHLGTGEAFRAASIFRTTTRVPGIRFLHDYAEAQQGYSNSESSSNQAHFTNSAPAIADLDGDGTRELVVLASVQNAAQSDRQRGVALWVLRSDGTRPAAWVAPFHARTYLGGLTDLGGNIVGATNQVSVADLDATWPGQEVVFAGFDGRIHCVGSERTERWTYAYSTSATTLTGGVAIADLSGDGRPEVVFASYSTASNAGALYVLSAAGALLHRVALPGRGSMAVPTVADVDRDGTLEIVVSLKDASSDGTEVMVFNVLGSANNCLPWPTGRANYQRNGSPAR